MTIGSEIRARREALTLPGATVALAAGIPKPTYFRVETSESPNPDLVDRINEALDRFSTEKSVRTRRAALSLITAGWLVFAKDSLGVDELTPEQRDAVVEAAIQDSLGVDELTPEQRDEVVEAAIASTTPYPEPGEIET